MGMRAEDALNQAKAYVRKTIQGMGAMQGQPGKGVPAGGTAGQILAKKSEADFDTEWQTPQGGGGGTAGVTAFNGRAGAVAPETGDYTADMVGADPVGASNTALTEAKAYTDNRHTEAVNHADAKLTEANRYTDQKVANLVGTAPQTLDTLQEVADALGQNESVTDALNKAIGERAKQKDLEAHTAYADIHITAEERAKWDAKQDALAGNKGQFIGFDNAGKPVATDIQLNLADYEVVSAPAGTLVDYREKEIRIMCPANTQWTQQQGGGDADKYYIGVKAYAPSEDITGFKEDLAETITDDTHHVFEGNAFAGTDPDGRKYSIFWLPVAVHDATQGIWTYSGATSTEDKYNGWYYSVEWYNADNLKVASDLIRINLSNENCHSNIKPFYASELGGDGVGTDTYEIVTLNIVDIVSDNDFVLNSSSKTFAEIYVDITNGKDVILKASYGADGILYVMNPSAVNTESITFSAASKDKIIAITINKDNSLTGKIVSAGWGGGTEVITCGISGEQDGSSAFAVDTLSHTYNDIVGFVTSGQDTVLSAASVTSVYYMIPSTLRATDNTITFSATETVGDKIITRTITIRSDNTVSGNVCTYDSAGGGTVVTDATPTKGSANPVQSGGVFDTLEGKQDKLTGMQGNFVGFDENGNPVATELEEYSFDIISTSSLTNGSQYTLNGTDFNEIKSKILDGVPTKCNIIWRKNASTDGTYVQDVYVANPAIIKANLITFECALNTSSVFSTYLDLYRVAIYSNNPTQAVLTIEGMIPSSAIQDEQTSTEALWSSQKIFDEITRLEARIAALESGTT